MLSDIPDNVRAVLVAHPEALRDAMAATSTVDQIREPLHGRHNWCMFCGAVCHTPIPLPLPLDAMIDTTRDALPAS